MMDEAYKGATASLDARERAEAALTEAATPVPDWSPPPVLERASLATMVPCVRDSEARQGSLADGAVLRRAEVLTRALSRLASDAPGVLFASVKLRAVASTHLDLDTDGLLRCEPRDGLALTIVARGRAEDGQRLAEGGVLHLDADALRDPARFKALEGAGRTLVSDVLTRVQTQRTMARLGEVYDGPVVLGAEAAAQLLAIMVAPHASGSPAPLSEYGPVEDMRPRWLDQLGQRVLPPWISLVDAPDLPGGFGTYDVDVEGVSPQTLTLVRDGVLEGLLMTRQPNAEVASSNGRARATLALGRGPAISNLRLEVGTGGAADSRRRPWRPRPSRAPGRTATTTCSWWRPSTIPRCSGRRWWTRPRDTAREAGSIFRRRLASSRSSPTAGESRFAARCWPPRASGCFARSERWASRRRPIGSGSPRGLRGSQRGARGGRAADPDRRRAGAGPGAAGGGARGAAGAGCPCRACRGCRIRYSAERSPGLRRAWESTPALRAGQRTRDTGVTHGARRPLRRPQRRH